MLGTPYRSVPAATAQGHRSLPSAAELGMRRVSFVRIVLSPESVSCHAVGTGHRRPVVRRVSLATTMALASRGVPTVVRSATEHATFNRVAG